MKRIKPALCTACGQAPQAMESARWPEVRVCYQCYWNWNGFMLINKLADMNPLYFSLVEDEQPDGNYPYRIELHDGSEMLVVMGPSRHSTDPHTSTTWHVQVPLQFESENKFEEPLDLL